MELQKISFLKMPDPDLNKVFSSYKAVLTGKRCLPMPKEYLRKALEATVTCRFSVLFFVFFCFVIVVCLFLCVVGFFCFVVFALFCFLQY